MLKFVDYTPEYRNDFESLNRAWIEKYFKIEEHDEQILKNPDKIIEDGGYILFVLDEEKVIGTCALIKLSGGGNYELAKMAVLPSYQGKGIGYKLGGEIVKRAVKLGATRLYLESNTRLQNAIHIYKKLGFKEVPGSSCSEYYQRCDIRMALELKINPNRDSFY